MVQIINKKPGVSAALGSAFGKGLADQLPQEVAHQRLSSGLRDFEKNKAGLSPLEQQIRLYQIKGYTPEMGYTMTPLLQQERRGLSQKTASQGRTDPLQNISANRNQPERLNPNVKQGSELIQDQPLRTLTDVNQTQRMIEPIQRKSENDILADAYAITQSNTSITPDEAYNQALKNEENRIANLQEERASFDRALNIENRAKDKLANYWTKQKVKGPGEESVGIPGYLQAKLEDRMIDEMANPNNKLSESQLVSKYGAMGEELGRANAALTRRQKSYLDYTPDKIKKTIDSTRSVYDKYDALPEFNDHLVNKFNLTPSVASHFTYPVRNEIKKEINSLQNERKFGPYIPSQESKKKTITFADNISNLLDTSKNSKDSILSIAISLKMRGYDPQVFIDRVKENDKMGLIKLNDRQNLELAETPSFFPSLGDLWMSSILNQESLGEP